MGAVAVFSDLQTTKKKQGKEDQRMKAVNEREREIEGADLVARREQSRTL